MSYFSDAHRLFMEDIRDKKRTGNGAFSKTGKGVKHTIRGVRFPSDSLSRKEKKELNSEVRFLSGLGVLMSLEELKSLDEDKMIQTLNHWRKIHSTKKIKDALGIDNNQYYKLMYDLGIIERPKSAQPKSKQEKGENAMSKRNHIANPKGVLNSKGEPLLDAKDGDILTFNDFKNLSILEQFQMTNDFLEKYTTKSIADVWGITLNNYYNHRWQLKNKLKKQGYIIDKEGIILGKESKEEKQAREAKEVQQAKQAKQSKQGKEQAAPVQLIFQDDSNDSGQEQVEINMGDKFIAPSVQEEQVAPTTHVEPEKVVVKQVNSNSSYKQEMDELRQLIFEQSKLIQAVVQNQQDVAASVINQRVDAIPQPIPQAVPQVVQEEPKRNEMVLNFTDEKEGFMLHQDIKRFISMLEKNPDMFEVEIKIKRKG